MHGELIVLEDEPSSWEVEASQTEGGDEKGKIK